MNDFDATLLGELWDIVKDDLPEKSKMQVAHDMLTLLEDNSIVSYDTLQEVSEFDNYLAQAVELIYKEDDEDEIDDDGDVLLSDEY